MKRSLLIALTALGISGTATTASAQDDVTVILGNVPNTITVLADGLANISDAYNTTGSFEATRSALVLTTIDSVSALVQDAPTLGGLSGSGAGLVVGGLLNPLSPIANTLDNPSAEGVNDNLFNPDDLSTILVTNVPHTLDNLTTEAPFSPNSFFQVPGYMHGVNEVLQNGESGEFFFRTRLLPQRVINDLFLRTNFDGFQLGNAVHQEASVILVAAGWVDTEPQIEDAIDPVFAEYLVPVATQPVLGQGSLADSVENLDFEDTLEYINYEGIVGMAGFEAP